MKKDEILRIHGKEITELTVQLLEAADLYSLLCRKAGESGLLSVSELKVGIKPNLVTCSPAEFGATTHPEIVEGIIRFLQKHGVHEIRILESSWVGDRTEEAFEYCGYRKLSERFSVPLFDTKKDSFSEQDCAGMKLRICDCVKEVDFLINVPVLKGHCQVGMTCALKNMKGLIPDSEKRRFHTLGLHAPIAHLNAGIRQDFIVIDDICGDPSFEEGGNPCGSGSILAALDPVLADCYACERLGLRAEEIGYLKLSAELGIGRLARPAVRDLNGSGLPAFPEQKTGRLLDVSYAVEDTDTCSACYSSLTAALLRLEEEGMLEKLPGKIGIGQGMQGKNGKLGVGNCTRGFDISIPGCPPGEEAVYEQLKAVIQAAEGRPL